MYNTDIPPRSELPSSRQLLRSTAVALVTAGVILVTVVLPAEYAVDPTGLGRVLGVTQMGEIKKRLAEEAQADRLRDQESRAPKTAAAANPPAQQDRNDAQPMRQASDAPSQGNRSDQLTIILKPGEAAEVKLAMRQRAKAKFIWRVDGGVVNFDLHGHGGGRSASYGKGRGIARDEGEIEADFDGDHGWFWRNRGQTNVTLTLRTDGAYTEIKRVI